METLFSKLKEVFSSSTFCDMSDVIVNYIKGVKNIESCICTISFEEVEKGIVEVKCDLIEKTNGEVFITRSFKKSDVLSKNLPQYILDSLAYNDNKFGIKLQTEDISKIAKSLNAKKLDKKRWFDIVQYVRKNNIDKFELEDNVFYTVLNLLDNEGNITETNRIAVINEMPRKYFDLVYPFKSVQISTEEC